MLIAAFVRRIFRRWQVACAHLVKAGADFIPAPACSWYSQKGIPDHHVCGKMELDANSVAVDNGIDLLIDLFR